MTSLPPPPPVQPQDVQLHGETETLTVLPFADEKSKGGNTARNQRLSDPNLGNLASGVAFLLLQMSPMILLYEERKNS